MRVVFLVLAYICLLLANEKEIEKKINSLEKPLYNPFVENYILHELKQLREENRDLKVELHKTLAKKEVDISNNVINYATSTINNMFYIIAAASSILMIIGWTSIKDMNEKIKTIIDERTSNMIDEYEKRLTDFEKDLEKRSRQVHKNQQAIETTNTIHSLWLRASQETTLSGKVEIYDEILNIRPDEVEALTYKADAVLDMGEANWALNLTNQAISIDEQYANAIYQRAKVYAVLRQEDNAIKDLEKAVMLNEQYINELKNEKEFKELLSSKRLNFLIKS